MSTYPDEVLAVVDATLGYGHRRVLDRLTLEVVRGEVVGLVGPSGCGKTTVLRALTGQVDVLGGEVRVLGEPVLGRAPAGIGYVAQLGTIDRDFPLTAEQVVLFGDAATSRRVPWFSRAERRHARAVLDRLGLSDVATRRLSELSGGQVQRTLLARALVRRSEILLLDEPTSGVDVATRRDVLQAVFDLQADGLTVLVTTHDLNFVAAHLPRVVCLQGSVTGDGSPIDVLTADVLSRTYGAPMRVVHDRGQVVVLDDVPGTAVGRVA